MPVIAAVAGQRVQRNLVEHLRELTDDGADGARLGDSRAAERISQADDRRKEQSKESTCHATPPLPEGHDERT